MAEELGSSGFFRVGGRPRYLRLLVLAVIAVALAGLLAARVHPVIADKQTPSDPRYVSLINHGQLQICRITPKRVVCPPLSVSVSKSPSASKSKSYSPSKSLSTSMSLSPSVHTQ
jgi:hypothetical protein